MNKKFWLFCYKIIQNHSKENILPVHDVGATSIRVFGDSHSL